MFLKSLVCYPVKQVRLSVTCPSLSPPPMILRVYVFEVELGTPWYSASSLPPDLHLCRVITET